MYAIVTRHMGAGLDYDEAPLVDTRLEALELAAELEEQAREFGCALDVCPGDRCDVQVHDLGAPEVRWSWS